MKTFSTFRPEYLPNLLYFWKLAQCNHAVLTDHLQYTKRSAVSISTPLNRTDQYLTIPVNHKPLVQPIYKKAIDDHNPWRKTHERTLYHVFHHHPYGYYYLPLLKELYFNSGVKLSDLLISLIEHCARWLNLEVSFHRSSEHGISSDPYTFLDSWAHRFQPVRYLVSEEIFTNTWLEPESLESSGIVYDTFQAFPAYHILETYKEKSILAFLMQFGPEAGYLIRQYL